MKIQKLFAAKFLAMGMMCALAACGEPRAVMLPLQYPDGSPVLARNGDPVMAGYQTFGTAMHANATALYDRAAPASCTTCAHVAAVVSEPSALRQTTGLLGASTVGAGAVMGGVGMMDYGQAAADGKLGTNVTTNTNSSYSNNNQQMGHPGYYDNRGWNNNANNWNRRPDGGNMSDNRGWNAPDNRGWNTSDNRDHQPQPYSDQWGHW